MFREPSIGGRKSERVRERRRGREVKSEIARIKIEDILAER